MEERIWIPNSLIASLAKTMLSSLQGGMADEVEWYNIEGRDFDLRKGERKNTSTKKLNKIDIS